MLANIKISLLSIIKVFDNSSKQDRLAITLINIILIVAIIRRTIFALTINRFLTTVIVKIRDLKLINRSSIKINLFKSSYY